MSLSLCCALPYPWVYFILYFLTGSSLIALGIFRRFFIESPMIWTCFCKEPETFVQPDCTQL